MSKVIEVHCPKCGCHSTTKLIDLADEDGEDSCYEPDILGYECTSCKINFYVPDIDYTVEYREVKV